MIKPSRIFVEEKLRKSSHQILEAEIIRCIKEINYLKERNNELEKRIEALESKA